MSTFNDTARKMGKFGHNWEFFNIPRFLGIWDFPREQKNPNGQLEFPGFGKNPEIWSHCRHGSQYILNFIYGTGKLAVDNVSLTLGESPGFTRHRLKNGFEFSGGVNIFFLIDRL